MDVHSFVSIEITDYFMRMMLSKGIGLDKYIRFLQLLIDQEL